MTEPTPQPPKKKNRVATAFLVLATAALVAFLTGNLALLGLLRDIGVTAVMIVGAVHLYWYFRGQRRPTSSITTSVPRFAVSRTLLYVIGVLLLVVATYGLDTLRSIETEPIIDFQTLSTDDLAALRACAQLGGSITEDGEEYRCSDVLRLIEANQLVKDRTRVSERLLDELNNDEKTTTEAPTTKLAPKTNNTDKELAFCLTNTDQFHSHRWALACEEQGKNKCFFGAVRCILLIKDDDPNASAKKQECEAQQAQCVERETSADCSLDRDEADRLYGFRKDDRNDCFRQFPQ